MTVIKYGVIAILGIFVVMIAYLTIRPLTVTTEAVVIRVEESKIIHQN